MHGFSYIHKVIRCTVDRWATVRLPCDPSATIEPRTEFRTPSSKAPDGPTGPSKRLGWVQNCGCSHNPWSVQMSDGPCTNGPDARGSKGLVQEFGVVAKRPVRVLQKLSGNRRKRHQSTILLPKYLEIRLVSTTKQRSRKSRSGLGHWNVCLNLRRPMYQSKTWGRTIGSLAKPKTRKRPRHPHRRR